MEQNQERPNRKYILALKELLKKEEASIKELKLGLRALVYLDYGSYKNARKEKKADGTRMYGKKELKKFKRRGNEFFDFHFKLACKREFVRSILLCIAYLKGKSVLDLEKNALFKQRMKYKYQDMIRVFKIIGYLDDNAESFFVNQYEPGRMIREWSRPELLIHEVNSQ